MSQRNQIIDFIRGYSILSVVLMHCKVHLPIDQSLMSIQWVKLLINSGFYGVIIFFVVSGFLITSISLKRWDNLASINLAQFYKIRFARIAPCLLLVLAISSLLHLENIKGFVLTTTTLQQALFSALTFQINWLREKTGYLAGDWDLLWSLSVEEMFYLFFPLLCITLRKPKYLIMVLLVFVVLGPINRTIYNDNDLWGDYAYLSCMDGIAIGCLAAMFAYRVTSKQMINSLLITGLLLFSFIFFFRKTVFNLGITSINLNVTILEIGIAFILIASRHVNIRGNIAKFFKFKSIQWFGRNSYEIYLTHNFIIILAATLLYQANQAVWLSAIEYVIIVLLSGIIGQMLSTYFSEPLNLYLRTKSFTKEMSYSTHG